MVQIRFLKSNKVNKRSNIGNPIARFRSFEQQVYILVEQSKNENCCLRDISFTTVACLGYLFLPPMIVGDSARPKFSNLIAYKMCLDFENDFRVMSYISFLDSLIDEANDVKVLRKAGVLYNCLGSDEEVAKIFNEIGTDLVPNTKIYSYVPMSDHKFRNTTRTSG